jgi:hypothetical protein
MHITSNERTLYLDYHNHFDLGDYARWEDECQAHIDLARKLVEYHKGEWMVQKWMARKRKADHKIDAHREKLNKILSIQEKYLDSLGVAP